MSRSDWSASKAPQQHCHSCGDPSRLTFVDTDHIQADTSIKHDTPGQKLSQYMHLAALSLASMSRQHRTYHGPSRKQRRTYYYPSKLQYRYDIERCTGFDSPREYLADIAVEDHESLAEYFINGRTPWQKWPPWFLQELAQLAKTVRFRDDLAKEGLRYAVETRRRNKERLGSGGPIALGVLSAVDFRRAREYVAGKYDWRELRGPARLMAAEKVLQRVSEQLVIMAPGLVAQAVQDGEDGRGNAEARTVGLLQRVAHALPYNDDVLEIVEEGVRYAAGQNDASTVPPGLPSPISTSSEPEWLQEGEPSAGPSTMAQCRVESQTETSLEVDRNDWDDFEQLQDNTGQAEAQIVTAPVVNDEQETLKGIEAIDETPPSVEPEVEAETLANVEGLASETARDLMADDLAKTTAALSECESRASEPLCKISR